MRFAKSHLKHEAHRCEDGGWPSLVTQLRNQAGAVSRARNYNSNLIILAIYDSTLTNQSDNL
jgi:hypothetical protein